MEGREGARTKTKKELLDCDAHVHATVGAKIELGTNNKKVQDRNLTP